MLLTHVRSICLWFYVLVLREYAMKVCCCFVCILANFEHLENRFVCFLLLVIIYSSEIFSSALIDGLSLEFELQQVSSSFQDSSQYFPKSQHYCILAMNSLVSKSGYSLEQSYLSAKMQSVYSAVPAALAWSYHCCGLSGLDSSNDIQAFGNCYKCTNYN